MAAARVRRVYFPRQSEQTIQGSYIEGGKILFRAYLFRISKKTYFLQIRTALIELQGNQVDKERVPARESYSILDSWHLRLEMNGRTAATICKDP